MAQGVRGMHVCAQWPVRCTSIVRTGVGGVLALEAVLVRRGWRSRGRGADVTRHIAMWPVSSIVQGVLL